MLLAALYWTDNLQFPSGPIVYTKFFPIWLIDVLFIAAAAFALGVFTRGAQRFWRDRQNESRWQPGAGVKRGKALVSTLLELWVLADSFYFLHLTAVFFLFLTAPDAKLAHFVYRTLALWYASMADRHA